MSIIHNNQIIPDNFDILLDNWKLKTVTGDDEPAIPELCVFNNCSKAIQMLNKHIRLNNKIVFHTDVDVDGIGTTYIMKKTCENFGSTNHLLLINKDKVHGIQKKHVDYFKNNPIDLIIITDSSSNEIDIIKQFNCDVLCIDHHELLHRDLSGKCLDGIHEYVIVNNTIDNLDQNIDNLWLRSKNIEAFEDLKQYKGTDDMSCGLVVYELLRIYCICFGNKKLLENLMLFQWVGITLLTDVISTLNERNQWYMKNTVSNMSIEPTLEIIMQSINKWKASLDKSYIQYTFAPLINKAIRAGKSNEALNIIINRPQDIMQLKQYEILQQDAIEKVANVITIDDDTGQKILHPRIFTQKTIQMDIGQFGISPNYNGVIASRLGGDNKKNAAIYIIEDGLCRGSFRGIYKSIDYRKYFENLNKSVYAQGHPAAFGFKLKKEDLDYLMDNLHTIEPKDGEQIFLTAGNMDESEYGKYHINDMNEFKRLGYLWRLAIGNSRVSSKDEIFIKVKASDVVLKSNKGKLFIYNVLNCIECTAFKLLEGNYFNIYVEYTNEINMYIR